MIKRTISKVPHIITESINSLKQQRKRSLTKKIEREMRETDHTEKNCERVD